MLTRMEKSDWTKKFPEDIAFSLWGRVEEVKARKEQIARQEQEGTTVAANPKAEQKLKRGQKPQAEMDPESDEEIKTKEGNRDLPPEYVDVN